MTIDLDLPVNDGISILRFLRKRTQALPVLVLAGCASVAERIRALGSGADDLVPKAFCFFRTFGAHARGDAEEPVQTSR